jgi:dTDP-4-dehydrorhamnose 3,5-epimerase
MNFTATPLPGVYVVALEPVQDDRGFFARTWSAEEFGGRGLHTSFAQCGISFTAKKATLRGLHFQKPPHAEAKLVRCTAGAIYDVALDLRPESETFRKWFALELTGANHLSLYIPEGCAHGLLTLTDNCEVYYQISASYHQASATGVRWNDPAFAITWPITDPLLSERDRTWPDFKP